MFHSIKMTLEIILYLYLYLYLAYAEKMFHSIKMTLEIILHCPLAVGYFELVTLRAKPATRCDASLVSSSRYSKLSEIKIHLTDKTMPEIYLK